MKPPQLGVGGEVEGEVEAGLGLSRIKRIKFPVGVREGLVAHQKDAGVEVRKNQLHH